MALKHDFLALEPTLQRKSGVGTMRRGKEGESPPHFSAPGLQVPTNTWMSAALQQWESPLGKVGQEPVFWVPSAQELCLEFMFTILFPHYNLPVYKYFILFFFSK